MFKTVNKHTGEAPVRLYKSKNHKKGRRSGLTGENSCYFTMSSR